MFVLCYHYVRSYVCPKVPMSFLCYSVVLSDVFFKSFLSVPCVILMCFLIISNVFLCGSYVYQGCKFFAGTGVKKTLVS